MHLNQNTKIVRQPSLQTVFTQTVFIVAVLIHPNSRSVDVSAALYANKHRAVRKNAASTTTPCCQRMRFSAAYRSVGPCPCCGPSRQKLASRHVSKHSEYGAIKTKRKQHTKSKGGGCEKLNPILKQDSKTAKNKTKNAPVA